MFLFILFLQDSPMFDRLDGCEYVFIWMTPAACPIQKNTGGLPFKPLLCEPITVTSSAAVIELGFFHDQSV